MNDDRYGKVKRYVDNLSKWVRGGVVHYNNAVNMLARLATFTQVIFMYWHIICFYRCFLLASSLFHTKKQFYGAGMFIPDPNFSIPDPGSKRFRIPDPGPHLRI